MLVALVLCFCDRAFADDPDFVPGRPGNTESPISLPQRHWQIESEIASYAHDQEGSLTTGSWSVAATSFRYGIAHGADVEVIVEPYSRVSGADNVQAGFGNATLRARRTFAGQDGGPSFALIGYVTLPTSEDHLGAEDVEGGLIATSAFPLANHVSATLTMGIGAISDDDDCKADVFGGANIGYSFTNRFSTYVEAFTDKTEGQETSAVIQTGATFLSTSTTQLDAGVELGITDAADDSRFFVGWAYRF